MDSRNSGASLAAQPAAFTFSVKQKSIIIHIPYFLMPIADANLPVIFSFL